MTLSERVREAIEGSQKTQADIARACHVTDAAITHLLKGRTVNLRAETALAMEAATGYRARWLLYGTGTKRLDAPYWPFDIELNRFERLTEKQKGYVERALEDAIEKCEATEPSAPPPPITVGLEGKFPRTDILPQQLRGKTPKRGRN